jgi:hypothetical protein
MIFLLLLNAARARGPGVRLRGGSHAAGTPRLNVPTPAALTRGLWSVD